MADQKRYRSSDPDNFEDDIASELRRARYAFGRSADDDYYAQEQESVPLFLSDPDSEPDPSEFGLPLKTSRSSVSFKLLMGVLACSGIAVLFALFTSDATRDIIGNAKASIAAVLPAPSNAAQPETTQLTANDVQLKAPSPAQAPAYPAARAPNQPNQNLQVATTAAPSREEISNAYQSALQTPPPAAAPVAVPAAAVATPAPAAPQARRIDASELSMLMGRARSLLDVGDISSARLLLERAADGQDANAAWLLARTYDPDVLGPQDVRNIVPDPAMAKSWYQKAAQLGSVEAQRRLAQLPN
jgi:hypothetical protein